MNDEQQAALHNEVATSVVRKIVTAPKNYAFSSTLVILESVVFGVLLFIQKYHNIPAPPILDLLYERVQIRLNQQDEGG